MGILFKTYNGKHQLHLYNEIWVLESKVQLEELIEMVGKKEASKLKIVPENNKIQIELNGVIVDCRDATDLKYKFGVLVDWKQRFQKITLEKPVKKKVSK